jgi:two-component system response regulator FixJ
MRMNDNATSAVFLAGSSVSTRQALNATARQFGAPIECFTEHQHCLQRLTDDVCSVLVIDMDGGMDDAVALLEASRRLLPPPCVLVLVEHDDIAAAVRAMKAGATDCLEKPLHADGLHATLEELLSQRRVLDGYLNVTLSRMEVAVLYAILEGKTNREVATALHRSPRTVEVHRRNIMCKLEASNVVELVKRAAALGLLGD